MPTVPQLDPVVTHHTYGPPVAVEVKVTIKALAFQELDGGYSVVVPELPGCVTEGDDIAEVQGMVVEAAGGWLAASPITTATGRSATSPNPFRARRDREACLGRAEFAARMISGIDRDSICH